MHHWPETNESLILRVKDPADAASWSDFLSIYRPVVVRMACERGLQHADADDLAQHVFLSVAKAIEAWEPDSRQPPFRVWLSRIGSYEIIGVLGQGGMGAVFKGFDRSLNRFVAIKMLLPHLAASGAARKRFAREGQAVAAVVDDHVMAIHCVDEWQGVPYLVMIYSRGVSLQKRLSDNGPLEVCEILRIGMQAAKGLAAAHAQGIVHRDIKPANIFLDQNVERVQLMDFGLARAVDDASLTRSGTLAGTPQYMSPEQARAETVDHRSDLFSLGSVMYAMCTGHAPFRAESSYSVLRLITDKEPRPIREMNPDVPEWLCALITKLMAKQASDRFESAKEVAELLELCLAHVQQPTTGPLPASLVHQATSFSIHRSSDAPRGVRIMSRFWKAVLILVLIILVIVLLLPLVAIFVWLLPTRAPQVRHDHFAAENPYALVTNTPIKSHELDLGDSQNVVESVPYSQLKVNRLPIVESDRSVRTTTAGHRSMGSVLDGIVENCSVVPLLTRSSVVALPALVLATANLMQISEESAPDDRALLEMEKRVRDATKKVMPCIVAVETASQGGSPKRHEPYASGVIIASDGLILSQYHVSHALNSNDYEKSRKPGDRIKVILYDGTGVEAELLGADRTNDLSLLRLVKPGPYSFAPIDNQLGVTIGDSVLKLGHPMGYRRGRYPVVRLGRVLCEQDGTFYTDCGMTGGDSGGPFFDIDGRFIGIVRNSAGSELLLQAAKERVTRRFDALLACSANRLIEPWLKSMIRGDITSGDPAPLSMMLDRLSQARILDVDNWTQGTESIKAYRRVIEKSRRSVVTIRNGADVCILGTVVSEDGWIITKASELPAEPLCVLPDGKVLPGVVHGVEPAFDVALLKVEALGLRPVEWASAADAAAGTFLATPGQLELPLAVGIVSVRRRDLPPPFPTRMTSRPQVPAGLPELIGSAVQGRGYWIEYSEGQAAATGIQPGDVILTIGGHPVRGHQDLATCVAGRRAGEDVPVRLIRAGKHLTLKLQMRADARTVVALRNDEFPTVFEHDTPLTIQECGGPVVGLDGTCLGINIAPVGPHGCMALPADCIQRMLPDLKSGKLAANWIMPKSKRSITRISPPVGKPVSLTVDDLKRRLAERNAKFQSLLVEYEVLSEANVEPQLLMEWNLHLVRDYQEHHRIAFAGDKRYTHTSHPAVMPMYAPQDQLLSSSKAPPLVTQAVSQQRQMAANNKAQGGLGHLFITTPTVEACFLFDGLKTFVLDPSQSRMVSKHNSRFHSPMMYLAGLGLRPLDPETDAAQRKAQQRFWFPDSIALFDRSHILPIEEFVNGFPCVVLECEYSSERDGKQITYRDKIWFDPTLDFAPRQWEQREEDTLLSIRTNVDFEDFGSDCWLPWESTWVRGTPSWAPIELRNQPAFTFHMWLRKARVNDVSGEVFTPK